MHGLSVLFTSKHVCFVQVCTVWQKTIFPTKTILVSLCILPHAFLNMWARKTNDGPEPEAAVGADKVKMVN